MNRTDALLQQLFIIIEKRHRLQLELSWWHDLATSINLEILHGLLEVLRPTVRRFESEGVNAQVLWSHSDPTYSEYRDLDQKVKDSLSSLVMGTESDGGRRVRLSGL